MLLDRDGTTGVGDGLDRMWQVAVRNYARRGGVSVLL